MLLPCVSAQNGSLSMCSAHPGKGDLPKYEGAAAEQEEYLEQSTRAHVGAILYVDKKMHLYFSKDLLAYADPDLQGESTR